MIGNRRRYKVILLLLLSAVILVVLNRSYVTEGKERKLSASRSEVKNSTEIGYDTLEHVEQIADDLWIKTTNSPSVVAKKVKSSGFLQPLDKEKVEECIRLRKHLVDIYPTGRSHTSDRPFSSFMPKQGLEISDYDFLFSAGNDSIPSYSSPEAEKVIACLNELNADSMQRLENNLKQKPQSSTPFVPIVIICHKRADYLKKLIDTLLQSFDIEETLIVFSHDGYFPEVQEAIESSMSINDKVLYLQIFNPFARKFLSHSFFNHLPFYEAALARHHYFWMWNAMHRTVLPFLNRNLNWNLTPSQLFMASLEEDHLVSIDFYQVIKFLTQSLASVCKDSCFSYSAGYIDPNTRLDVSASSRSKFEFDTIMNAGLSFNSKMFNRLLNSSVSSISRDEQQPREEIIDSFKSSWCGFNEYNWDFGLLRMSQTILPGISVTARTSRVAHAGGCGMHHSSAHCDELYQRELETFINPMRNAILAEPIDFKALARKMYSSLDSLQWKPGKLGSRSLQLHEGFGGWLEGLVHEDSKPSLVAKDQMFMSDDGHWFSTFNAELCMRITRSDPIPSHSF